MQPRPNEKLRRGRGRRKSCFYPLNRPTVYSQTTRRTRAAGFLQVNARDEEGLGIKAPAGYCLRSVVSMWTLGTLMVVWTSNHVEYSEFVCMYPDVYQWKSSWVT